MSKTKFMAWSIWMIASIFYAYQYIIRVMPNIMLEDIMQQYNMNASMFGQYAGLYYLGYVAMHLPIGILLDLYGPKKIMSGCILLTVLGMLPILVTEYWLYPVFGRILIGMGSSAAILGVFKIIRMTFDDRHFSRMLSLSVTIGLIGAIYGGNPVENMCSSMGYHTVIIIFSGIGIALAIMTYILVPEMIDTPQTSVAQNIKSVFSNYRVLQICFFAGLLVGPLEGFADVWGKSFLTTVYNIEDLHASFLTSLIFIGFCFGGPVLCFIADKTENYFGAIIAAGITMFIVFMSVSTGLMEHGHFFLSFLVVGICCSYQIIAIYKASTYVPETAAGLTTAVSNMIIMSFGYMFHTLIGAVIDSFGGTTNVQAFVNGIFVIPTSLALGILGFTYIAIKDYNRNFRRIKQ